MQRILKVMFFLLSNNNAMIIVYTLTNTIGFLRNILVSDTEESILTLNFFVRHYSKVNHVKTIIFEFSSSSSFEGHPLQVRHKQDWGRGFILLLPQTAALPGSDAGSDVTKPASSFVIQNPQTSCSMWCPIYRARC